MKAQIILSTVCLAFIISTSFAQKESKKRIKEDKKIEKQQQVEALINAKAFDFIARMAMPTEYKTVNLSTTTNYVKFQPDLIDSFMPFYGRAYSGVGYGGDEGLKFTGKPEKYTIIKEKKNFQVNATVKGEKDTFTLSLSVGFEEVPPLPLQVTTEA